MTKIDLGPVSRDEDVHNFQVTASRLVERIVKDKKGKDEVNKVVELLTSCIKSLADLTLQPIS